MRKRGIILGFAVGLLLGLFVARSVTLLPTALSADKDEILTDEDCVELLRDFLTAHPEPEWRNEFIAPMLWAADQIDRRYVEEVKPNSLLQGALEGMTSRLDDYSSYMPPRQFREFKDDSKGEFGGLGITIRYFPLENTLRVEQPIPGTPAFRDGLLPGDVITKIFEQSTKAEYDPRDFSDVHDAVRVLRGKVGTRVTLTVVHKGSGKVEEITITRDVIKVPGVRAVRLIDEDRKIGYAYVANFHERSAQGLNKAVAQLKAQGAKALIVDLRFNPGGLLKSAIDISNMFLSSGMIVSTRGRSTRPYTFRAGPGDVAAGMPLVILVNRYSASASEIVTGALKDHGRAIIIGETTFGKGSVQTVLDSRNGGDALKITTARYYMPSGVCIEKVGDEGGVKPHIEIELTDEDMKGLARALAEATEFPKREETDEGEGEGEAPEPEGEGDAEGEGDGDEAKPEGPFIDLQLQRAVDVLTGVLIQKELGATAAKAK